MTKNLKIMLAFLTIFFGSLVIMFLLYRIIDLNQNNTRKEMTQEEVKEYERMVVNNFGK